ncbi:cytochrome P450 94B3-like [Prosopis cineraria]|uniref:cytochrome P450 94B3-like n=1 Tax=Prosopis cineraria TaxID=364024 RepID=UPI00240FA0EC|nr:cytochrome P450 94B3-like [Prosopis cineraria]
MRRAGIKDVQLKKKIQNYVKTKSNSSSSSISHGPPSYPIIGCLISFYQNRHRLLDWYTHLLSESPTQTILVRRLGARRTIITANPSNVEFILKTNFHNFPKGKPFTEILGDLLGCGIFNVDGELWSEQRKIASHGFSTRSLKDFIVKTLEEEVQKRLIPLFESASITNQVVDLQDILRRFTFDSVCKVSLGTDPCCLDLSQPDLPPLVQAFDNASAISARRATAPVFLIWKLKRALNIGSEKSLKQAVKLVHESVLEIIRNKKKNINTVQDNEDLLTRLLLAGYDEVLVRDLVISFIMAGRDTTSAAMTWLFWLISKHPNIEEMIEKEMGEVFGSVDEEDDDEVRLMMKPFDYQGLKEMNFLKACLCESMRLYPPVPWDSKHAAADGVLPDGTAVKRGDRVTYFPYGMGRMKELWGKDWQEFRPDRWFDEPVGDDHTGWVGTMKQVSPYKFPVFQAGPRVCLGKEMAYIQMKHVVASIVSRFRIKPVCENQPVFVPLLTAHMAGGFKVRIYKKS